MNIWALDKDLRIKHLLLMLDERLGSNSFEICETSTTDAMSVRIYKTDEQDMSAYLYTHGQDADRYGVHLEYPPLAETATSKNIEMQEDLDLEQLVSVLQVHLM